MAKKKKKRLKLAKATTPKKKSPFTWSDYLILGLGAVAAVAVAVWGGYFLGQQSEEEQLTTAIQSIINRAEGFRETEEFEKAEKMLRLAILKHPDEEMLKIHLARVYLDQGEVAKADTLIHEGVKKKENLLSALREVRAGYRRAGQTEDSIRISKELVQLE